MSDDVSRIAGGAPRSAPKDLQAAPATGVRELLSVAPGERDLPWLKVSLQRAVEIEHATIPVYLTALWSIQSGEEVRSIIKGVISDEMRHMGLACNMLVAIGGTPRLTGPSFVPSYPGPLPGGVLPELTLTLGKLTRDRVRDEFIAVERPAAPTSLKAATYPSIGEFYEAIAAAFLALKPQLSTARQLSSHVGGSMAILKTVGDVQAAIDRIAREGEGVHGDAETLDLADPAALAHYYKFGAIFAGRHLVKLAQGGGHWAFAGAEIPWPSAIYDMAEVPPGGYGAVTLAFNSAYSHMLDLLQEAWTTGDERTLSAGVAAMFQLEGLAVALMQKPLPDRPGSYGPDFRYIPPEARG
jgi:hypothetical protein